jgi:hypothetical protein
MKKACATVTLNKVTITVSGKTQHSSHEVRECARLTAEVLNSVLRERLRSSLARSTS